MLNLYGRKGELMDGILLVNKPSGMTSHDVVRHPMVQKILECYEKYENS